MARIARSDLVNFCREVLEKEGMEPENAQITAEVLSTTDAFGIHSHGTKNLHNYIKKTRAGGAHLNASIECVLEGASFAELDAGDSLGMVPAKRGMDLAVEKAEKTGVALVTVKNSCHFGAAGYYANLAAKQGMIGLCMSNVDPNMTVPGARGMLIGNNPFSYAAPATLQPSVFLDIAMSNVASLKVVQARKDKKLIPETWIVDKDGLPTNDPSHYPEEGAMQPMAAHKGYGMSMMVELLTGILSGGGVSALGDIESWCFSLDKPNNVSHTFIAIDAKQFLGVGELEARMDQLIKSLREAPKARNADRIYVPGEMEWERYQKTQVNGIELPTDVRESLEGLAADQGIAIVLKG